MTLTAVVPPFPLFTDRDGAPLDAGFIYVGVASMNPVSHPIAVYWDSALTVPAAQPIRTSGGYPSNNGAPGVLFSASDYSITVKDKNGVQLLTQPSGARAGLGSIVLAATESLTAQSGASIDLEDGSELNIGTATGTGVLVTMAINARFVGNVVPNATGTQSLGNDSRRWDVFADDVDADAVSANSVTSYADFIEPSSPANALVVNQRRTIMAAGVITVGGGGSTVSAGHFGISGATGTTASASITVDLDEAVEDDALVICQPLVFSDIIPFPTIITSGTQVQVSFNDGGLVGTAISFGIIVISRPRGGVTPP